MMKALLSAMALLIGNLLWSQTSTHTVTNLSDTLPGSLRAAVDSSSAGDTIHFSESLLLPGVNETLFVYSEILIAHEIYLLGLDNDSAKLFLSGADSSRIFRIDIQDSIDNDLEIESVFFCNAHAKTNFGNGGAIYIEDVDTFKINNSSFNQCVADGAGGAIFSRYVPLNRTPSSLEIQNTHFSNNEASYNNAVHIAINYAGDLHLTQCEFSETKGYGNVFEFFQNIYMRNCLVRNNGDSLVSTRVFISNNVDSLYVDQMQAYDNITTGDSPIIWGGANHNFIENSTFYNNTAGNKAGVFLLEEATLVRNSQFFNNEAQHGGVTSSEKIRFENCIFKGNKANFQGGVIFSTGMDVGRYVHFYECELDSNTSLSGAGAISIQHTDLRLEKSSATRNIGDGSGAISNGGYRAKVLIDRSTIAYNQSLNMGGALIFGGTEEIKITNSTIARNRALGDTANLPLITGTDSIEIGGTIIWGHSEPSIFNANFNPVNWVSTGHNIFEFDDPNFLPSDITNLDSSIHLLDSLSTFSGIGMIMKPKTRSLAINRGNPSDSSDAQNGPIFGGIRDIGAAESSDSGIVTTYSIDICDSTVINGKYVKSTGYYIDSTFSQTGLDSTAHLWIENVNISYQDTQRIKSCDSIQWLDGNIYAQNSNSTYVAYSSIYGCDSILYLDFKRLNETYQDTQVVNNCQPYTWIDGITYTQSTQSPSILLQSSTQCDSLVYLSLTLDLMDTTISQSGTILTCNQNNVSYFWVNCSQNFNPIANATQQSYTVTQNGTYAVIMTRNGCRDTSVCITVDNIGLDEIASSQFEIFPNPTQDAFSLEIKPHSEITNLALYNSAGMLVWEQSLSPGENRIHTPYPSGVYHIQLTDSQNRVTHRKLIIQ
ncbi:MAG: hypothetical protein SchgKO_19080 [Schleiferiaceae bacterium]